MNLLLLISVPLLLYLQVLGSKRHKAKYTTWVMVLVVVGMAHDLGYINLPLPQVEILAPAPPEIPAPATPETASESFDPYLLCTVAVITALGILAGGYFVSKFVSQRRRVWRATSPELPRPREPGDEREIMDAQNEDAVATEPTHEYEAQVNIDREEAIYARITGDSPEKVEKKPFDRVSAVKEESEHPILSCPKCGAPYDGVECSICGYRVAR